MIVLTGEMSAPPGAPRVSFGFRWVHVIQARMAGLSTRGRQFIAPRSGHGVPVEDPEAVAAAVHEILQEAR
jgi:pimeloyl-ACP methyl ester carboxylesterase